MTTQEIANRLVELSREGKAVQAYQELFADDAVAIEPFANDGSPGPVRFEGKEALLQKSKAFESQIEAFHGSATGDPIVAGDHFACTMMLDVTMKGFGRMKMEEVCMYEVKDGKIVTEQFFYHM